MIKNVLLITVGLLACYDALLYLRPVRRQYIIQSQWQENVAKAQDYLLETNPKSYVVVGSSMMARFSEDSLGEKFENLAFHGGSVFTGLELVQRRSAKPQVVFIESNLVLRSRDTNILDNAFRPVLGDLRRYVPALCERYQPANLLAGKAGAKVLSVAVKVADALTKRKTEGAVSAEDQREERELFNRVLATQREEYGVAPDPTLLQSHLDLLEESVCALQKMGIRCVFVELPIDSSLMELPAATAVRSAVAIRFPENAYCWVRPEPGIRYPTTDGVHLTAEGVSRFAGKIIGAVSRVSSRSDLAND